MLRFSLAAVNDKGKLLEGKEADTKRQQDMTKREVRVEHRVDVFDEKIIVFIVEQNTEIQKDADDQRQPAQKGFVRRAGGDLRDQKAQKIVQPHAHQNDGEVVGVEIAVEPQGHTGKKKAREPILFQMVQAVPAKQDKRQKYENKKIGIKLHREMKILPVYHTYFSTKGKN